jgi:hypothetical protein
VDDCIGVVDECGVCNGPGATEVVIEDITILYDSVYADQIDTWFVFEVGADTTFSYQCDPSLQFSCGDPVSYQGYDYETVQIGEQCWFAENLRAENYRNGDPVPSMNASASGLLEINDVFYYQWEVVNDLRGICPSGWQVPSVLDYEGLPLPGSLVSHPYSSNWNGYIPWGSGQVSNAGQYEVSWTRQEYEFDSSQAWRFADSDDGSELGFNPKDNGETIRCIKDTE